MLNTPGPPSPPGGHCCPLRGGGQITISASVWARKLKFNIWLIHIIWNWIFCWPPPSLPPIEHHCPLPPQGGKLLFQLLFELWSWNSAYDLHISFLIDSYYKLVHPDFNPIGKYWSTSHVTSLKLIPEIIYITFFLILEDWSKPILIEIMTTKNQPFATGKDFL